MHVYGFAIASKCAPANLRNLWLETITAPHEYLIYAKYEQTEVENDHESCHAEMAQ